MNRSPRVFHGWYVLGILMLGALFAAGTSQVFFSIMLKPISDEFGWSRTALAGMVAVGTIGTAIASPLIGRLSDRWGSRAPFIVGAVVTGVSCLLMPAVSALWHAFVVYGIGRMVAGAALVGVTPATAIANWFRYRRGRAMGLLSMCVPLGNVVLVLVGQVMIDSSGWRTPWLFVGAGTLIFVVVPAVLLMRSRPEEMGLRPDGLPPEAPIASIPASRGRLADEVDWTAREAMRTPALWLIAAAGCLATMANSGVSFHQVAYLTDVGIPPLAAVVSLALFSLTSALGAVTWGYLTERVSERTVAVAVLSLGAAVNLYLLTVRSLFGAIVFALLFGLTSRTEGNLLTLILAEYYGRRSFGTISGVVRPFALIGLALGPLLASFVFDLTGTYQVVFLAYAGLWVLGAACLWLARKPVRARSSVVPL